MAISSLLLLLTLVTLCMCNVVMPRKMWGLFKSWRFKNPESVEPSELVILWYRSSGLFGAILLVTLTFNTYTDYRRHERCADLLPELQNIYAGGGLPAVQRRAQELDLEVQDLTYAAGMSGKIVITDNGEPFATLFAIAPADGQCNT